MNEKRFALRISSFSDEHMKFINIEDNGKRLNSEEIVDLLNEQQDNITELEKNFDDLVQWSSEISKRNVVLDEQIGQLQRENEQLKEEEKLYAQEILRLNTLLKQYQANQDLGGGY